MSEFFGYRHIFILPYNAQANGTAESAVKRIKLLLDRQTEGYADWHKQLPLAQLLLNTTVHTGTGVTPFMALFGRAPNGLEQLENPALLPLPSSGDEFLKELRVRLMSLHKELQLHSDAIKLARTEEETARKYARLTTSRFGHLKPGGYAWVIHGSKTQADYTRKHGHGLPWKHRYKILEVRPYAVLLEIPKDNSVPKISPWQLIRKVSPADDDEHAPTNLSPRITEMGVPIPSISPSPMRTKDDDFLNLDDNIYEIESVHHAEKVGRYFRIWIKWKGYDEISWRWRHQLVKEITDTQLLSDIEDEVNAARDRAKVEQTTNILDDEEIVSDELDPKILEEDFPSHISHHRIRKPIDRFIPIMLCSTPTTSNQANTDCSRATARQLFISRDYLIAQTHAYSFYWAQDVYV